MSELDLSSDNGKSFTTVARLGDASKCKRWAKKHLDSLTNDDREFVRFRIYSPGERLIYFSEFPIGKALKWEIGDQTMRFEQSEKYVSPQTVEVSRGRRKAF